MPGPGPGVGGANGRGLLPFLRKLTFGDRGLLLGHVPRGCHGHFIQASLLCLAHVVQSQ